MCKTARMSIGRMDLNLIKVFDAVYEERNLVRAGKRLHLTQSAVSHALGRLREVMGDELFVRTPQGMAPTQRASSIAGVLRDALRNMEAALGGETFDASRAQRRFVVAANDHLTAVLLTPLAETLQSVAPGVDLLIRPSTRLDLAEQIDIGGVDVALGIFAQVPQRLAAQTLFADSEALVMNRGHPLARRKVSLRDLGRYALVTVAVRSPEEGSVGGFILERGLGRQVEMFDRGRLEEAMRNTGDVPRFRVTVPHSLAIPDLLAGSDMVSIVPESLAVHLCRARTLIKRPMPYVVSPTVVRAVWHNRNQADPAHRWLREMIAQCCTRHSTEQVKLAAS
jgi:DNA-binding transcriptional LysR family regulator